MEKLITVIIPVYNAESFLSRCLDSVIEQTYNHYEVFLVDDGSSDSSGMICDAYAEKDCRINVIHKQNEGAGLSRNLGIEKAKGDYLVFIDADDYVDKHYFELLSRHDEDIVFINIKQVSVDGIVLKDESVSKYSTKTKDEILRHSITGKMNWGGVRKAVKTQLVRRNNIKYSLHKVGEEAIYTYRILMSANSIGFLDYPCYYYVQHSDSLSHARCDNYPLQGVAKQLEAYVKDTGAWLDYGKTVNALHVFSLAVSADRLANNYSYSEYKRLIRECHLSLQNNIDLNVGVDYDNMNAKARMLYCFLKHNNYLIVWALCRLKNIIK